MKKNWVWLVVIVVVVIAIIAYTERHSIKAMMGMSPTSVPAQTTQAKPTQAMTAITSDNIYLTKTDATKGSYMTDFQGMTLYTFDKDTQGVSNCYNGCAKAWPPYT